MYMYMYNGPVPVDGIIILKGEIKASTVSFKTREMARVVFPLFLKGRLV